MDTEPALIQRENQIRHTATSATVGRMAQPSPSSLVIDVPEAPRQSRAHRRVIHATCSTHGGCIGFTNLVVTKRDGTVVLDPHVTGQCVLTLAEEEAIALRDALTEWLG